MKRFFLLTLLFTLTLYLPSFGQTVALKSNLLPAIQGTLNAGVELGLGRRTTLEGYGSVRPRERKEKSVKKYWLLQTEIRHWMCQKFNGTFVGGFINGAQFNVGGKSLPFGLFSDLKAHRYEGYLLGAGATIGHQLILDHHWNVEFSISAGYEYIHYKRYRCPRECSLLDKKDNYHYIGPTKAAISLIYLF